ncbi:MAG: hypothetical protein SVX43_15865, partial [Cyanobacteriota bacterium]|nr:hypothetical protein [Cyanobacteriota bacterium]
MNTDNVKQLIAELQTVQYAAEYRYLAQKFSPECLQSAWNQLNPDEQSFLTTIVEKNHNPEPVELAIQFSECNSREELENLKARFGEKLTTLAWKAIPKSGKERIKEMCRESQPEPLAQPSESKPRTLLDLSKELENIDDFIETHLSKISPTSGDNISPELQLVADNLLSQ